MTLSTKAQIAEFWQRISHYCLVENKQYWDSLAILPHTLDATRNMFGYSIWATSMYSFGQVRGQRGFTHFLHLSFVREVGGFMRWWCICYLLCVAGGGISHAAQLSHRKDARDSEGPWHRLRGYHSPCGGQTGHPCRVCARTSTGGAVKVIRNRSIMISLDAALHFLF